MCCISIEFVDVCVFLLLLAAGRLDGQRAELDHVADQQAWRQRWRLCQGWRCGWLTVALLTECTASLDTLMSWLSFIMRATVACGKLCGRQRQGTLFIPISLANGMLPDTK